MNNGNEPTKGRSVQYGKLAEASGEKLEIQVMESAAGYYLGTRDGADDPVSRESEDYYRTEEQAQKALKESNWTQRESITDGNNTMELLSGKSADALNAGREERHRIAAKLGREREAKNNNQLAQAEKLSRNDTQDIKLNEPDVESTEQKVVQFEQNQNQRKPRGRRR
jgi:hypothetical protein